MRFLTCLSLRLRPFLASAGVSSFGTMSSKSTSSPMFAKWQAMPEPMMPDPMTATFLMIRFISGGFVWFIYHSFLNQVVNRLRHFKEMFEFFRIYHLFHGIVKSQNSIARKFAFLAAEIGQMYQHPAAIQRIWLSFD